MIQGLAAIDENIARKWVRTALRKWLAKIIQRQCVADAPDVRFRQAIKVRAGKRPAPAS